MTPEEFVRLADEEESIDAVLRARGFTAPMMAIPWIKFTSVKNHRLTPEVMCLWWLPVGGQIEVFTGRVAHWPAADAAMVARKGGSMVRVAPGAFFAVITPPIKPPALDDVISVVETPSIPALK